MAKMMMKKAFEDYMDSFEEFVEKRGEEYDIVLEEYESVKASSKPSLHTDRKLDKIESNLTNLRTYTNHEKGYSLKTGVSVEMRTSMDLGCVFVYPTFAKPGESYASHRDIDLKKRNSEILEVLEKHRFQSTKNNMYSIDFANANGETINVGSYSFNVPKDKKYAALSQELFKIYMDENKPAKKAKRNEGSFSMTSSDIEDVIRKTENKFGPGGSKKVETADNDLIDMTKKVYETEIKDKIDEADKAIKDKISSGELDESLGDFMGMVKEALDIQMDLLESEKKGKKRSKK